MHFRIRACGCLFAALVCLPVQSATIGGGITSFSGWSASIRNSADDTLLSVDPESDTHFVLNGDQTASLGNDYDYYEVSLFRMFDVPNIETNLSFQASWTLSSYPPVEGSGQDFVQALIVDPDSGSELVNLFIGLDTSSTTSTTSIMADLAAYAGSSLLIEFLLQDGDFNEIDLLTVGHFNFTASPVAPVPIPAAVFLFASGLLTLRLAKARERCQPQLSQA